jgi:TonB-linked SusC/RagA family outer membrane protein
MKLTTLLLITVILHVSASTMAQKVTLKEKNAPLIDVFDQIRAQTGYDFAFTTEVINNAKPVTITVKNEELKQVLTQIFQGQDLEFSLDNKTVTISLKESLIGNKIKSGISIIDVAGRITDENSQPLAGATVTEKGTSNSTSSDANGFFNLKQAQSTAIIVISFIGFDKKELPAQTNLGQIKLYPTTSKLDEVKVIAYGQTSQRLSIGNVSSINAKDIENQPVNNPLLALEGRIPGLSIRQSSGINGSGVTVRIQGTNSIASGNDPLYVIDGVPYVSQMLPTTSGGAFSILGSSGASLNSPGGIGNPMNYINPNDIESISVLKDAEATSIYGSRAANGAILIVMKKGTPGRIKTTIDLDQGWGFIPENVQLMNTQQYIQMRKEAKKNDNSAISATDYDINGFWDTTRYTNWQKVLIGNTAKYTNANASVSGGTNNLTYLIGSTYNRQTTVFPGNFNDQRAAVHFNINSYSNNRKFNIQFTGSYLFDDNQLPAQDLFVQAMTLAPDAPSLHTSDGSLNWMPNAAGTSTWLNPLAPLLNTYENKTSNLLASAQLSYQIINGLTIKSDFGYNTLNTNELILRPLLGTAPESRPFTTSGSTFTNSAVSTWIIEPQLTYKRTIGPSSVQILLGGTIQQRSNNGQSVNASGFNSDASLADINSAGVITPGGSVISQYRYNAYFGRVNYNLSDKYLLEASARRDGSSRFGPANSFHGFWSVGGGWIFSNESFLKTSNVLSFGKIKASYGTTGNDQIGDYSYLSLYNPVTSPVAYQGIGAYAPKSIPNPYLQWEETRKLSVGVDFGFLKDRIIFSANYSRNRSSNQLLGYNLPTITGFSSVLTNFPATIQNTDFEFSVQSTNINSASFRWNTNFNLTIPRNKVLAFPSLATSTYNNLLYVGQPLSIVRAYRFGGVNPVNGTYYFLDTNGNSTTSPNLLTSNTLENVDPQLYGGLQNSFSYKGFTLDFLLQFVKQNGVYGDYLGNSGNIFPPGRFNVNQPTSILDSRWQKPGDQVGLARFTTSTALLTANLNARSSDVNYGDASYIRLKNLSISYSLKSEWVKKMGLQNLKLFALGQNLLTMTKYKGVDPESGSSNTPPLHIVTVGLKVGL